MFGKAGEIATVLLARYSLSKLGSCSLAKDFLAIAYIHMTVLCEQRADEGARRQSLCAHSCEKIWEGHWPEERKPR